MTMRSARSGRTDRSSSIAPEGRGRRGARDEAFQLLSGPLGALIEVIDQRVVLIVIEIIFITVGERLVELVLRSIELLLQSQRSTRVGSLEASRERPTNRFWDHPRREQAVEAIGTGEGRRRCSSRQRWPWKAGLRWRERGCLRPTCSGPLRRRKIQAISC